MTAIRAQIRTKTGTVEAISGEKTVRVLVHTRKTHSQYKKIVNVSNSFLAHDDLGVSVGDTVEIASTRKFSKRKNWRVITVLETKKAVKELAQ